MKQIRFGCNEVLVTSYDEKKLKVFYIGYDLGECRLEDFTEIVMDSLVDFAFGYHTGILKKYNRRDLKEAAKSLYSIKAIRDYKEKNIDQNKVLDDDDILDKDEQSYQKRGEFGELILHIILRDFFDTAPLLSKIHFKDSDGMTVHGFDSVHIGPDLLRKGQLSLFLGESKLYSRKDEKAGEKGVKDLVDDIKNHFNVEFFKRECLLIAKKIDGYKSLDTYVDHNTKDAYEKFLNFKNEYMRKLKDMSDGKIKLDDFVSSITVPLICTYQSPIFKEDVSDGSDEFKKALDIEVRKLKNKLDDELSKLTKKPGQIDYQQQLNIVLILLPIPSKKQLITKLHTKLWNQQNA